MNFKKLLAAFSAGAVAVSAMSAVAVSAKAQEAFDLTYSTVFEDEIIEGKYFVSISADKWQNGLTADIRNTGENNDGRFLIKGVSRIYFRQQGRITDVEGNLDRYIEMTKSDDRIRFVMAPPGSESSTVEIELDYRMHEDDKIEKGDIKIYGTNVLGTHLVNESSGKREGFTINKVCRDIVVVDLEDEEVAYCDVEKLYRDVVENNNAGFLREMNAKAAKYEDIKLTFVFDKDKHLPEGYETNEDYDWKTAMKSITLIINEVEVKAKPEINVGTDTCTLSFNWDDIKGQEEIFRKNTEMDKMILKVENDYLDTKITDPDEVMDLELIEVNFAAPKKTESGEVKEDTAKDNADVGDFSAGASAVVFETTL